MTTTTQKYPTKTTQSSTILKAPSASALHKPEGGSVSQDTDPSSGVHPSITAKTTEPSHVFPCLSTPYYDVDKGKANSNLFLVAIN